ncbi:hypothetical protein WT60_26825 [Burkholderia sp. MSMB617WGS]|nr:hypothetical protein WT60_26825 [Burkholderia sp. MSMB617WGS]
MRVRCRGDAQTKAAGRLDSVPERSERRSARDIAGQRTPCVRRRRASLGRARREHAYRDSARRTTRTLRTSLPQPSAHLAALARARILSAQSANKLIAYTRIAGAHPELHKMRTWHAHTSHASGPQTHIFPMCGRNTRSAAARRDLAVDGGFCGPPVSDSARRTRNRVASHNARRFFRRVHNCPHRRYHRHSTSVRQFVCSAP